MPRGKKAGPKTTASTGEEMAGAAETSTLLIRGQIGPAQVEISIKGLGRRPLVALLDEILGAAPEETERP